MTICEKCGTARPTNIPGECPSRHFQPRTLRELANAAVLTSQFEAGAETYGTPEPALEMIAQEIRAGRSPVIKPSELARHWRTVKAFLSVTDWDLVIMLARFFGPGLQDSGFHPEGAGKKVP